MEDAKISLIPGPAGLTEKFMIKISRQITDFYLCSKNKIWLWGK